MERRQAPRATDLDGHGIVRVRIRPGRDAVLLDISSGGACVETSHRLLPGTLVELQLESHDRRRYARARVMRCAVCSLDAGRVCYRAALSFTDALMVAAS